MNDEMDIFFNADSGSNYLESLVRARCLMANVKHDPDFMTSRIIHELENVILLEVELARLGAEKALSESKKATAKVTPLKGV